MIRRNGEDGPTGPNQFEMISNVLQLATRGERGSHDKSYPKLKLIS